MTGLLRTIINDSSDSSISDGDLNSDSNSDSNSLRDSDSVSPWFHLWFAFMMVLNDPAGEGIN